MGGIVGILLAGWLDPGGHARLDFASMLAGCLGGMGIHRALRG